MFEPECTRPSPSEMIYDSRVGESDGMTFFIFYYPPHSTDCYTPLIIYLWLTHFYRIHAQDILFCRLPPLASSHLTFLYIAVTLSTLSSRMRAYINVYTACTLRVKIIYIILYLYICVQDSACIYIYYTDVVGLSEINYTQDTHSRLESYAVEVYNTYTYT